MGFQKKEHLYLTRSDDSPIPVAAFVICGLILLCTMLGVKLYDATTAYDMLRTELTVCIEKRQALETRIEDERRLQNLIKKSLSSTIEKQSTQIITLQEAAKHIIPVDVTAYTLKATPTASGEKQRVGTVAVSRDLHQSGWSFGKHVHIKDMGIFKITDLMGRDKNGVPWKRKLDIWVDSRADAAQIGTTKTTARLL